jgi:flagellar hook-associated protein 2
VLQGIGDFIMASVTSTGIVENYDYGLNPSIAPNSLLARTQQTTTPLSPSERAQISPAGKLRSSIASLEDAAALLARADAWSATQTFSSDNTTVSALSAVGARNGQYRVSVDAMATAQTVTSANFSSLSTVIGLGS